MFETMESRTMFAANAFPAPTPHNAAESVPATWPSRVPAVYASAQLDLSPEASRSQFSAATAKQVAIPAAELNS